MKITGRRFRLTSWTGRVLGFGLAMGTDKTLALVSVSKETPKIVSWEELPPSLQFEWIDPPCSEDDRITGHNDALAEQGRLAD